MELIAFLLIVFLVIVIALAIGGAAVTVGDNRSSEKSIHETGQQTRADIDAATRDHKEQTFNYLYKKHQDSIREVLHE
jgi:uncharacterized protein (UPF0333 family)